MPGTDMLIPGTHPQVAVADDFHDGPLRDAGHCQRRAHVVPQIEERKIREVDTMKTPWRSTSIIRCQSSMETLVTSARLPLSRIGASSSRSRRVPGPPAAAAAP